MIVPENSMVLCASFQVSFLFSCCGGGGLQRSQLGILTRKGNIAPAELGGGLFKIPALIPVPSVRHRVGLGGNRCTRRTWWWLVHIPSPHTHSHVDVDVDPCSFLAFEAIGEDLTVPSRGSSEGKCPSKGSSVCSEFDHPAETVPCFLRDSPLF